MVVCYRHLYSLFDNYFNSFYDEKFQIAMAGWKKKCIIEVVVGKVSIHGAV